MSLKQEIEKAYKQWEQYSKGCSESIEPKSSNFLVVSAKIKKLKDDLCKFADNFDKNFISVNVAPITKETIDDVYIAIKNDFVGKIADGSDYFIYGVEKTYDKKDSKTLLEVIKEAKKEYPESIKIFNSKYKDLKSDFAKANDLVKFFEEKKHNYSLSSDEWKSDKMCRWIEFINGDLNKFMSEIFSAIAEELKQKSKILIAKDSEYFDVIPDIEDIATQPDALNKIISFFENNVEKIINDEEYQKLVPAVVQAFKEKLKSIDKLKKKADKLTPQDLKDFLPPKYLKLLMAEANSNKNIEKHLIAKVGKDVKVFPAGKPLPKEVKQAGVGDCYLMSTLIALAKTNPKAIEECFIQSPDNLKELDELDKIVIRFFDVDPASVIEAILFRKAFISHPVRIAINKNTVIMPQDIRGGALWPKLIEKAYAVYRKQGHDKKITNLLQPGADKNLRGGVSSTVMLAITGELAKVGSHKGVRLIISSKTAVDSKLEKFKPEKIIETLKKILGKGKAIICTFQDKFETEDVKNGEKIKIYDGHGYAIVGFGKNSEGKEYIRLIEPNKVNGRTYSANVSRYRQEPVQDGGHVAMPLEDFKSHFDIIEYTSGKSV